MHILQKANLQVQVIREINRMLLLIAIEFESKQVLLQFFRVVLLQLYKHINATISQITMQ